MSDYEKLGVFYLGREYNLASGQLSDTPVLYDSKDLTTHALCVGMTGSGKTGLCLSLLEEAAIDGLPAICIDPKGDLGNLLLTFPSLKPSDFKPWIDPGEATRKGLTVDELAARTATQWKDGLAAWDQPPERIARFRESADVCIYTPGSTVGVPLTILKSLSAPPPVIRDNAEAFRERIGSAVSGLLALLGVDADPLRSREHILLSTLVERSWREGQNLELGRLIRDIQQPPFDRVGFLDLESFFPAKDRFSFAMSLNNLLASPGFQAWMTGEPLDIQRLLYTPEGKPRIAILSISHLSDAERMFFVTILLGEVISWMRAQSGTTALRALLYMDEIFGYFPPSANPPSKQPMLTLLKQARAFGLGCVLATQNPVDLDYKGLSNCGTWLIGRLQTERDKLRVLDGLEGASTATGHAFDRSSMEKLLSSLGSRVFLMNNVHDDQPTVFQSRWALSYLRGPLSREQIQLLMDERKSQMPEDHTASTWHADAATGTRPVLPPEVSEVFIERSGALSTGENLIYHPALYATARIHFTQTTGGIDEWQTVSLLLPAHEGEALNWEAAEELEGELTLASSPDANATFTQPPAELFRAKTYTSQATALKDCLYRSRKLSLFKCADPKGISLPGESEGDFRQRLDQGHRDQRELAKAKIQAKYQSKLQTLEDRLRRAEQTAEKQKSQANSQTLSAVISFGTSLLGAFTSRKKISTTNLSRAATSARAASRVLEERGDVGRAEETVEAVRSQIQKLQDGFQHEIDEIVGLDPSRYVLEETQLTPKKTDMKVERMILAWVPFKQDRSGKVIPIW